MAEDDPPSDEERAEIYRRAARAIKALMARRQAAIAKRKDDSKRLERAVRALGKRLAKARKSPPVAVRPTHPPVAPVKSEEPPKPKPKG